MEDKKTTTPSSTDTQPKTEPQKTVSIDLFETKSKEDLKKEARLDKKEFGAAGVDDINKNMGSFGPTVAQAQEPANEIKLDVDAKVVEKAANEKIDFERFKKTKKDEKAAKTRFGEKVSMMLRTKKGLRTTWIIEMVVMVVTMAAACVLVGLFTKWIGYKGDGPMHLPEVQKYIKPGVVFGWIAIFPCLVPLIYLLTTWFIGINQVASSRLYHFLFWGFALFGLVCLIICLGLLSPAMNAWVKFPAYH